MIYKDSKVIGINGVDKDGQGYRRLQSNSIGYTKKTFYTTCNHKERMRGFTRLVGVLLV